MTALLATFRTNHRSPSDYIGVAERVTHRSLTCILASAAFVIIQVSFSRADEELWKNCTTTTTHYILQVPASLVPAPAPGVSDCVYRSDDGEFNVEAAEQADNQTLDAKMQKELELLKGTVTDQKKGDNWFALTGVSSDGTEFYRLHYTNGTQWVSLRMTFPHSKAKKYDDWVDRIDKEFVPFAKAEEKVTTDKVQSPRPVKKDQQTPIKVPPFKASESASPNG